VAKNVVIVQWPITMLRESVRVTGDGVRPEGENLCRVEKLFCYAGSREPSGRRGMNQKAATFLQGTAQRRWRVRYLPEKTIDTKQLLGRGTLMAKINKTVLSKDSKRTGEESSSCGVE